MAEELARCLAGIVRLFCVIFCLIVGLQQIAGTASLLLTDWKGLKKGPKQILYHKILFEAACVILFNTNAWSIQFLFLFL